MSVVGHQGEKGLNPVAQTICQPNHPGWQFYYGHRPEKILKIILTECLELLLINGGKRFEVCLVTSPGRLLPRRWPVYKICQNSRENWKHHKYVEVVRQSLRLQPVRLSTRVNSLKEANFCLRPEKRNKFPLPGHSQHIQLPKIVKAVII